jgi:hypothetical protein
MQLNVIMTLKPNNMEECYGKFCELRQGAKCLHPDVIGDSTRDEPSFMIVCPKVKAFGWFRYPPNEKEI